MKNHGTSGLPYLIVAALGAISGALSVLLARKESREYIRDRGTQGLEYLHQTGAKLRERTEVIVGKGRELMSGCCASPEHTHESTAQAEHENKPEIH